MSSKAKTNRIVLLLDLDCFYAQCECIRLGYDASTTALALLQWNSVLAVTYPARTHFGVARGDSWQVIQDKVMAKQQQADRNSNLSCDTCHAIHVPLLTTEQLTTASQKNKDLKQLPSQHQHSEPTSPLGKLSPLRKTGETRLPSLEEEYLSIFQLSTDEQHDCRRRELGVRRLSNQGKASIERYRIASARIFQVVQELIAEKGIQLERASIDEFFLDVTCAVLQEGTLWNHELVQIAQQQTRQVMDTPNVQFNPRLDELGLDFGEDPVQRSDEDVLFWRGAAIALAIRQHVFNTLGFTLTAGVGNNKTVAKLTASYGKPNGQAVTTPSQIPYLLRQTPIRKCRNLGGKLGTAIQELLYKEIPSMDKKSFSVADISRHLSLPGLRRELGAETAQWVFELSAYGTDDEPVKPKHDPQSAGMASKTKSITAFKSLPNSRSGEGHSVAKAGPWIHLLLTDLVTRIQRDAYRNGRFPKCFTLHYTKPTQDTGASRLPSTLTKSVRVPFPSSFQHQDVSRVIDDLSKLAAETLLQKEGVGLTLTRVGFSASDFVQQQNSRHSIERYFSTPNGNKKPNSEQVESRKDDVQIVGSSATPQVPIAIEIEDETCATEDDTDLVLAKNMQAQYDEEHRSAAAPNSKRGHDQTLLSGKEAFFDKWLSKKTGLVSAAGGNPTFSNEHDPKMHILDCDQGTGQVDDNDLALAKKLQAKYDLEDRERRHLDLRKKKKLRSTIDSFFLTQKNTKCNNIDSSHV